MEMKMNLHPFPPAIIPHSTQDLPKTPADTTAAQIPANIHMDLGIVDYDFIFDDIGYLPESPQINLSETVNFAASPADAPEDGRPCGTDADMLRVNAAATPPQEPGSPVPVGGGHAVPFGGTDTTEVQHLELVELLRLLIEEEGPLTAAEEKLVEAQWRLGSFRSAIKQDLLEEESRLADLKFCFEIFDNMDTPWSIVPFTGPGSKGRKPHQARWKEQSMTGMRAVADPSLQPGPPYIGLKKTLDLDDDGNGNKWRSHEYTPLLPPDDDPSKLVPAEISLRFVYKVDEPPSSNSKRPRPDDDGPSNGNGPRVSDVWEHMTRVHVKVATDNAADGSSKRKKNPYKLMYAICNHCDKVFNADPKNGTNNQSKHSANCKCDCPQSH